MAAHCKVVDDFCRLCAIESQSGVIIYSAEGENLCLEEKIINCLRIEVSKDDLLPKRVCQSCNLLLDDYYRFLERATQVQQTLYFLLGLDLPHVQDQELCFLEGSVKLESNLIKKEFDDVIMPQGSVTIEGEKYDLIDRNNKDQNQGYEMRSSIRADIREIEVEGELDLMKDLFEGSIEANQVNKRKKIASNKTIVENIMNETDSVINENLISQECFKSHISEDKISFTASEELLYSDTSSEDDEEAKQMECEWRKLYGIFCDQCKNVFPDKLLFDEHYKFSHNKKPVYACSFCKKSLGTHSSYKHHVLQHVSEGKFKCRFCNKKFCSKEMLQIHSTIVHIQSQIFICEECGLSFTSQSRLDLHLNKHKSCPQNELRCTECGKTLQTKGGLAAHKSIHERSRPFMCHICGKTFTQKINMQQHVKHHKGERPHVCDICGKSFAEKSHLNRHKSFHMEERPFQCPVCKKMYKTERCLKVHSQIHWNSRPYICSICGKGFLSSTKLKQHHNCHTGERPYACKYCERTFTNYPNWLKHTRRRHQVDHKTGLELKSSGAAAAPFAAGQPTTIEFIEMPDVEVKEDRGDGGGPLNVPKLVPGVYIRPNSPLSLPST